MFAQRRRGAGKREDAWFTLRPEEGSVWGAAPFVMRHLVLWEGQAEMIACGERDSFGTAGDESFLLRAEGRKFDSHEDTKRYSCWAKPFHHARFQ